MTNDLYFINCVREVLNLSPLHHGAEGDKHHTRKNRFMKIEELVASNCDPEEEDELKEIMRVFGDKAL